MYPNSRGIELRSERPRCNASPPVYAYCPPNEAPYPSPHPPFLRGQPELSRYDMGYYQPHANYFDPRPRGFLDRPSSRISPYGALDGLPGMPTGVPQAVRTVPTSITVPPSKKLRNRTESTHDFVPFPPHPNFGSGYAPRGPPRFDNNGQSLQNFSPIQLCAWIMGHCLECKNIETCVYKERCAKVKSFYRHMMECTAESQCTNDKSHRSPPSLGHPLDRCYPVKRLMHHYKHCRSPQCMTCDQLQHLIRMLHARLNNGMPKSENGESFDSQSFVRNNPMRRNYRPCLSDGSLFGDRPHQEYGLDQEPDAGFYGSTSGNGFLVDPQEGFGMEGSYPLASASVMHHSMKIPEFPSFKLGTSLFETFTPHEIERYLKAIRESDVLPSRPEQQLKEKVCAVCLLGEQTFQPIQLYCDCCFAKIKRGGMYWKVVGEAKMQICVCQKCFSLKKGNKPASELTNFQNQAVRSCKNDECVTETWVKCDKCGYWVHASCGLFNRGENNDDANYMCPFCLKEEMEMGHRIRPEVKPMSMWGARELPGCSLSDFIQSNVDHRLQHEIKRMTTPVACPPLTIRVLMSVKKTTKVQSRMAESFRDLPESYPYRQKVIGVFQKIHGVDVLVFCMYVQEYGDECSKPNQRWVNLEYIDSVKHFTPDARTASGEALRSIVYQETLLAYIEFVKRSGFEVFYIWACPPAKEGEDYILHCKPKNQRIPTDDRLRGWYKKLLRVAKERSIVTHDSNLLDTFFSCGTDRPAGRPFKASEMPYFEGDYWPGEAERILKALGTSKLAECCRKPGEKRKTRGEMSVDEVLENGLMVSLPFPRWSDFMVWHLQEPCSLCSKYITNGYKYVYHFESNTKSKMMDASRKRAHFEGIKLGRTNGTQPNPQFFQICGSCYRICETIGEGSPTPDAVKFADLVKEEVLPFLPPFDAFSDEDTKFSEIFESRQAFLAFCKGNHYQFDTLQHAKHSTMMLLYHLHNTTAPVFPTFCRACGMEVAPSSVGRGVQMDICQTCRMKGIDVSIPDRMMGSRDSMHTQRMMNSFDHAAYCNTSPCAIPECRKMKELFVHVRHCETGVSRCSMCRFYASFLKQHVHFCTGMCQLPGCEQYRAVMKKQRRLDQAQRSRAYNGEASGSSSTS